jgi:hypothetical protein
MIWSQIGRPKEGRFPGADISLFATKSRSALKPTQLSIQSDDYQLYLYVLLTLV